MRVGSKMLPFATSRQFVIFLVIWNKFVSVYTENLSKRLVVIEQTICVYICINWK